MPFNNQLYELDGLQQGPIHLGECTNETWIPIAREEIQKRIQKYAASEIRFNLLAICKDKLEKLGEQIKQDAILSKYICGKLGSDYTGPELGEMETEPTQ